MDWSTFLKIGHIIGTVLGAGAATLVEFQLFAAARDGSVNPSEGRLLSVTFWLIRIGLIMIVFSGFGFFLYLRLQGLSFVLYEPRMWAKLTITGLLVMNAFLMHVRRIPLWVGAAISITGWYTALVLGAWRSLEAEYVMIMATYVVVLLPAMWLMRYLHDRPVDPKKS
jgi:hypothetical protein